MGTSSIFTGSSQFSSDFQNVITRAVAIASLPINQLNNDLNSLKSQSSALSGIDSKFAALQSAVAGIGTSLGGASFQADVSDKTVLSATVGNGAAEGYYSVEVLDTGAYSTSMTAQSWSAPVNIGSSKHTYQLWAGNTEYDITPDDNSASTVAAAINAKAGGTVQASAANVGSASNPDWRITLKTTTLDDVTLQLQDGATDLQDQTTLGVHGHNASYIVNNSGNTVSSTSRTVNITDGLNVTLLKGDPGNKVGITLTRSSSALGTALSNFADAYNGVVGALDQQHGGSASALGGDSLLYQLSNVLRGLATYSNGGQLSGLAALGLDLGSDGKLTFTSSTLASASTASIAGFLGSVTGGGFLKSATDALSQVEDADTGILKTQELSLQHQTNDTSQRIADRQTRIDTLQKHLQEQMSVADAAIASMEQQYSYLSNMFAAMQTSSQQYK